MANIVLWMRLVNDNKYCAKDKDGNLLRDSSFNFISKQVLI